MIESKPKQKSHTPIQVVFPIVDLDSICFFDKDEEEISKYKEEYSMILEYWKEFLNDPKIMEYGIKFCRDSAICTISKGFQKDIRYSSFICKRSQIDAILHKII